MRLIFYYLLNVFYFPIISVYEIFKWTIRKKQRILLTLIVVVSIFFLFLIPVYGGVFDFIPYIVRLLLLNTILTVVKVFIFRKAMKDFYDENKKMTLFLLFLISPFICFIIFSFSIANVQKKMKLEDYKQYEENIGPILYENIPAYEESKLFSYVKKYAVLFQLIDSKDNPRVYFRFVQDTSGVLSIVFVLSENSYWNALFFYSMRLKIKDFVEELHNDLKFNSISVFKEKAGWNRVCKAEIFSWKQTN